MARTITEIKTVLKVSFMNNEVLSEAYGFELGSNFENEFSKVSLENLLVDVVSYSIWILEQLFDLHRNEVVNYIDNLKPHSLKWYRTKARMFQYGHPLITDTDRYDNSLLSAEEIERSQIIKYCAVNEAVNESRLIVKIATENQEGILSPIGAEQLVSFKEYLSEIKDAGLSITVTNFLPDILDIEMKIYYDPLIFSPEGSLLIDGSRPVEDRIKEFLKDLPFNGVLQLVKLVDSLQSIDGVIIPHVVSASSSWINPSTGLYGVPQDINVFKIPESGYFMVNDFGGIIYEAYG